MSPVNVAKAVESGVGRERLRGIERELSGDGYRDAFAVVQAQAAADVLVAGAIQGDMDD